MKRRVIISVAFFLSMVPLELLAEVCVTDDGFIVPCPPSGPQPVQGYWSVPSSVKAGVAADFYIYGGGTVAPESEFLLKVNNQFLCATDSVGNATPIRHCVGTISTPGTYSLAAYRIQGNFLPPQPIFINVSSP